MNTGYVQLGIFFVFVAANTGLTDITCQTISTKNGGDSAKCGDKQGIEVIEARRVHTGDTSCNLTTFDSYPQWENVTTRVSELCDNENSCYLHEILASCYLCKVFVILRCKPAPNIDITTDITCQTISTKNGEESAKCADKQGIKVIEARRVHTGDSSCNLTTFYSYPQWDNVTTRVSELCDNENSCYLHEILASCYLCKVFVILRCNLAPNIDITTDITCQTISTKNGEESAKCADKQGIKVIEARRVHTGDSSCNLTTFYSYPQWDNVTTRVSELCDNENICYLHEILASCYLCNVFVILRCNPAPNIDITTDITCQTISTKNGEDSAKCADKQGIKVIEARRVHTGDSSCNLTTFDSYPQWDNVTTRVSELCDNENSCYLHEILALCYLCKVFVILRCKPAPNIDIITDINFGRKRHFHVDAIDVLQFNTDFQCHVRFGFFFVFVAANTGLTDITCQTISTKNGEDSAKCADKQGIEVIEARRVHTGDTSCNLTTFYSYPQWDNVTTRVSELCDNENSCYLREILALCYLCKVFVILRCKPAPNIESTTVQPTFMFTTLTTSPDEPTEFTILTTKPMKEETTETLTTSILMPEHTINVSLSLQSKSTVTSTNNGPTNTTTPWLTATLNLTASTKRYESTIGTPTQVATTIFFSTASTETSSELPASTISTPSQVATTIFLSTASTETSSELPVATIAGAAGGGVGVMLIVVVTVTLCRKSKYKRKPAKRDETSDSGLDNIRNSTIRSRMFLGDYKPKQMLDQFENGNTLYGTHKASDTNDSTIYGSDTYDHTDRMFKRDHNNVEYVAKNPIHVDEEDHTSYDFKF